MWKHSVNGFASTLTVLGIFLKLIVISEQNMCTEGEPLGILFPQDSESRELKTLDGIWNFRIAPRNDPDKGFREQWNTKSLDETGEVELMPVPSSYNDITQKKLIRDHVGWAWYDRNFWIPKEWMKRRRVFLRFGGVNYHAVVWVNGVKVLEHSGGHLPFLVELSNSSATLVHNLPNRITVAVNNTLSPETVPQGEIFRPTDSRYPPGYFTLNYNFDFFNYAGIHRSVYLYTTPQTYIDDVSVHSTVNGNSGILDYSVKFRSGTNNLDPGLVKLKESSVSVALEDKQGNIIGTGDGEVGIINIPDAKLWWPFTMVKNNSDAGYLYTLVVTLTDPALGTQDFYRLKVGIRSIKWTNTSFLINEKPFYFRGFGRHEDFNIRGKGIDNVMLVKDHNLVKWTGANSYRTSHYPYSEEIMDLTDRLGIVIIDECPAVSLNGFGDKLLENHKASIRTMIQRDKNRASVIMWSVGNEPQSQLPAAENYFKDIVDLTRDLTSYNKRPITLVINQGWNNDKAVSNSHTFLNFSEIVTLARTLDPNRPITLVVAQEYDRDVTAKFLDIICINRYFSWYSDAGHTEVIKNSMIKDVQNWVTKFGKPVIVAEYGGDTIAGIHNSPEYVFSEEYQLTLMREHFKAFDFLRQNTSLIGEHIWNFADFMTAQGITRVSGNRKGIFTRDRQPKASAHYLRTRYHMLAKESDEYPLPIDLGHEFPIYTNDM